MLRSRLTLAVLGLTILSGACGADEGGIVVPEQQTEVAVEVGDPFTIELATNPSVGDQWRIVEGPDDSVVTARSSAYEPDDPGLVGGGGTTSFSFDAVAPGTTQIEILDCYRCLGAAEPAPENEALSRTIRFTVTVR